MPTSTFGVRPKQVMFYAFTRKYPLRGYVPSPSGAAKEDTTKTPLSGAAAVYVDTDGREI